jgi:hypothetical protein
MTVKTVNHRGRGTVSAFTWDLFQPGGQPGSKLCGHPWSAGASVRSRRIAGVMNRKLEFMLTGGRVNLHAARC